MGTRRHGWVLALVLGATACSSAPPTGRPDDGSEIVPPRRNTETTGSSDELVPSYGGSLGPSTPSCSDGLKNGDETDVDCGGSCATTCAEGRSCGEAADCSTDLCVATKCCSRTSPTTKTSGAVSGTGQICCDGAAVVTAVKDCGQGTNHTVVKVSAQCAEAHEGTGNNGTACVEITCAVSTCAE